jgi:hypothetical protein
MNNRLKAYDFNRFLIIFKSIEIRLFTLFFYMGIPWKNYMKQSRILNGFAVQHYGGWSLEMTSSECRNRHTFVNPISWKMGDKRNKKNSW